MAHMFPCTELTLINFANSPFYMEKKRKWMWTKASITQFMNCCHFLPKLHDTLTPLCQRSKGQTHRGHRIGLHLSPLQQGLDLAALERRQTPRVLGGISWQVARKMEKNGENREVCLEKNMKGNVTWMRFGRMSSRNRFGVSRGFPTVPTKFWSTHHSIYTHAPGIGQFWIPKRWNHPAYPVIPTRNAKDQKSTISEATYLPATSSNLDPSHPVSDGSGNGCSPIQQCCSMGGPPTVFDKPARSGYESGMTLLISSDMEHESLTTSVANDSHNMELIHASNFARSDSHILTLHIDGNFVHYETFLGLYLCLVLWCALYLLTCSMVQTVFTPLLCQVPECCWSPHHSFPKKRGETIDHFNEHSFFLPECLIPYLMITICFVVVICLLFLLLSCCCCCNRGQWFLHVLVSSSAQRRDETFLF